jgi:Ca2+-binding EF-hand superfamily protein
MRKFWIIGGAVTLFVGSAMVVAKGHDGHKSRMDTDGNGTVSKAEMMSTLDTHFARMDVNKDGKLDASDRDARRKEHFGALDANKDGSLSESEFMAARQVRSDARAQRDGAQSSRKMGRHAHRGGMHGMMMLHMADTNGDNAVSRDEARAAAEAHFAKVDANKDGSISAEERKAAREAMRAARAARTGKAAQTGKAMITGVVQ